MNISRLTMRAKGREVKSGISFPAQSFKLHKKLVFYFTSFNSFVFYQGFDRHLSAMTQFCEPWPLWFGFICCFFLFCWPTGPSGLYWLCYTIIKAYIPAFLMLHTACVLKGALWLCGWTSKPHFTLFDYNEDSTQLTKQLSCQPCNLCEPLLVERVTFGLHPI